MFDDERDPPDREIDKLQAIRHLLHSSIRLLFWEEDPFALHLICQSCDKLIIDCMEVDGIDSPVDFASRIKSEYLKAFYRIHRETYNYLKHAKEDRHAKLGVRNIVRSNEISIFLNVARFNLLVNPFWTAHVRYFLGYTNVVMPNFFKDKRMNQVHLENQKAFDAISRSEALALMRTAILADQEFLAEKQEDLADVLRLSTIRIRDYKRPLASHS